MRFRWLLPLCNIAIDIFLLVVLVHAVDVERSKMRRPPPLWRQDYEYFDPGWLREVHTPEPLVAIIAGTPPAALIASLLRPNGWRASSPFDVRWTAIYLVMAALFWYAAGWWAETRHPRVMKFAKLYVLFRVLLVPVSLSVSGRSGALVHLWTNLSHLLLLSVWFAAASYLILRGAWFLYRRITSPPVQAA